MKEYYKNPRKISKEQFEFLKKSLEEFGDLSGIVHDLNSDQIISGNQRSKIFDINKCKIVIIKRNNKPDIQGTVAIGYVIYNGYKYFYRQVRWNKEQCERANIIANKAGGEFDYEILAKEFDLETVLNSGFNENELELKLWDKEIIEDKIPKVPKKTKIKIGDKFKLGDHILICGDSTKEEFFNNIKADMIFTDPPYDMSFEILDKCFNNVEHIGKVQFWMGSDKQIVQLAYKHFNKFTHFFVHYFINATMINSYRPMQQHTLIAKFMNKKIKNYNDGFTTVVRAQTTLRKKKHKLFNMGKSVELPAQFIKHYCDDTVLDIFGGYGSTLIVAEQLNKKCIMIEINPFYCDLIIQRWENFTKLTGFATETKGQLSKYKFGYQVALGLLNKMLEHFGNADLEVVKEVKSFLHNNLDSLYSNLDREC